MDEDIKVLTVLGLKLYKVNLRLGNVVVIVLFRLLKWLRMARKWK